MTEAIELAFKWQESIGATVGGVFSLLVALLVAKHARQAEERSSAMLLIGELQRLIAMVEQADAAARSSAVPPDELPLFLAHLYAMHRVRLSPVAEAAMSRVMLCDVHVATCLTVALSIMRDTESAMARVEADLLALHHDDERQRDREDTKADMRVVSKSYATVAAFAKPAAAGRPFMRTRLIAAVIAPILAVVHEATSGALSDLRLWLLSLEYSCISLLLVRMKAEANG